jgi:hypothetical protein
MNRRDFLLSSGGLLLLPLALGAAEADLVLVAGGRSQLPAISPKEVRKIFLGVQVHLGEKEVVPFMNGSITETKELFLQKVLFMSASVYERHMVGRVFRSFTTVACWLMLWPTTSSRSALWRVRMLENCLTSKSWANYES